MGFYGYVVLRANQDIRGSHDLRAFNGGSWWRAKKKTSISCTLAQESLNPKP